MNRALAIDFYKLRLAQKRSVRTEMGFGSQYAHESDGEYDKRFFSWVSNEGKIRQFEALVLEQLKRG